MYYAILIFLLLSMALFAFVSVANIANIGWAKNLIDRIIPLPKSSWRSLSRNDWLTLAEFSRVEKYTVDLRRVVVVASQVQEPTRYLAEAVMDNFRQGVSYSFFVPRSAHEPDQLNSYFAWFEHLYMAALGPTIDDADRSLPVAIEVFPLDWDNVPYVFLVHGSEEQEQVIGFKGVTKGVGISDIYEKVETSEAAAIIMLCSQASADFRTLVPPSVDVNDIFPGSEAPNLRLVS